MPTFLYRKSLLDKEELNIIKKYFDCFESFSELKNHNIKDKIVIPRFRATPYPFEVEDFVQSHGFNLINSAKQHRYIANFDYYYDVENVTPKTWFRLNSVPKNEGPFVLKGTTTSKKSNWNTKMFASNIEEATKIYLDLCGDYFIGSQDIIIRKFEEFEKLEEGINGMPIINEHRIFFYKDKLLSHGFYWSISEKIGLIDEAGLNFANKVAKVISKNANYFVLDIAKRIDGEWRLIEVNDGSTSGLSCNDADNLYYNLSQALI